jgi:hypothetical protein
MAWRTLFFSGFSTMLRQTENVIGPNQWKDCFGEIDE